MKSKHARHSYATSLFKNEYIASVFKVAGHVCMYVCMYIRTRETSREKEIDGDLKKSDKRLGKEKVCLQFRGKF